MRIITPTSESEFQQYYTLRWRILRKPWGQKKGSEQDDTDTKSNAFCHHVMVVDNTIVCAVARLEFPTKKQFQLRYMAVDYLYQGKGIGRSIIEHVENYSRHQQATELFLNARENAVSFYEKLGYEITEKSYLLFGSIQHFKMHKIL